VRLKDPLETAHGAVSESELVTVTLTDEDGAMVTAKPPRCRCMTA
jgi:hypothetical protein